MKRKLFQKYLASLFVVFSLHVASAHGGVLPQSGEAQYELQFWQSIQDSTNAEDYEAYLEAYPEGRFAPLARTRAARYRAAASDKVDKAENADTPAAAVNEKDLWYEVVIDANIRSQPDPRSEKQGTAARGSRIHVTGEVVGKPWYRVEKDRVAGYVFAELLREPARAAAQPAAPAPAEQPAARPAAPPRAASESAPTADAASGPETLRDCPTCPDMIALPAGSFSMGSAQGDPSERPVHKVAIKQPFAIGKHEVSVAEWNACAAGGGCAHRLPDDYGARSPARDLSWDDARDYVRWLSGVTGKQYRLPTEAEWEYAARAGTSTRYWWGDSLQPGNANCRDCGAPWNNEAPADVDALPANPFGLHGTSGGVWEWVADCWHSSYAGAPADGGSWDTPDCREYVIRGGAWRNDSSYAHSASRFKYDAYVRYLLNGFRVARTLP